jgi:signal transduction histidine kinase
MTEYVIRTCKPLLLSRDVEASARALGIEPIGRDAGSWLGAPLVAHGEPIGVIALQDYERAQSYNEHDREVLAIIASQAAAAFHNARLFAAMRHAYRELSETQGRLLENERLRGVTETVGALNHEINNPLAAIAGNAQLLLRRPEGLDPETHAKIESILDAARRIQRVTGRMATLIQATSMPYPGQEAILDIHRSLAGAPESDQSSEPPQQLSA